MPKSVPRKNLSPQSSDTQIFLFVSIYTNMPLVLANPDRYGYFVEPDNSMVNIGIGMNVLRYPTNITAFRQAIVHALNYMEINDKVFFDTLVPMVGPEFRAVKEFYDLGNLPPYSYDLDLAKKYLAQSSVNVATLPPLEFRVIAGCSSCINAAQVVQAQLFSGLGITVTVEVTPPSQMSLPYTAGYSTYQASVAVAQQEAQLTWMGYPSWAPEAPTPADIWVAFGNYNSPSSDYANYANPVVQKCVDAWFSTADVNVITNACTAANAQYYNDAPYIWLGSAKFPFGGGTLVHASSAIRNSISHTSYD